MTLTRISTRCDHGFERSLVRCAKCDANERRASLPPVEPAPIILRAFRVVARKPRRRAPQLKKRPIPAEHSVTFRRIQPKESSVRFEAMREPEPFEEVRPRTLQIDERHQRFIRECCAALEVDHADVIGKFRGSRPLVEARQILAWVLRARWQLSYPNLARLLARDHTTMIVSVRKVQRAIDAGEQWAVRGVSACQADPRPGLKLETALESLSAMGAAE
jgi:hypothetical protein